MKLKKIVFALTIMCLPALAMAQTGIKKVIPVKIDLGLKLGANLTSLSATEWESGMKAGFHGGLLTGVNTKHFGGQLEVLFSKVKYTGNGVDFYNNYGPSNFNTNADSGKHGDFIVSYISVPVLLNVKIGGPIWFQLGPQFSGLLSIKDKDKLLKDTKSLFNSGEVSGIVGLQLQLTKIRAGLRYNIGLSDMNPSSVANVWKQRTLQLYFGLSFL